MMEKRVEWVDIGKYICIMCVLLSHLQSGSEGLHKFYGPFFLVVFFFLSGYVYTQPKRFKEHLIKKIRGLFVPWLIFSNFNILLSAVVTLKGERDTPRELLFNFLQIRGCGDGIWFVAALFVAFIPFYFVIHWNQPRKAIGISILLSIVSVMYTRIVPEDLFPWGNNALPWHIEYMFQAMLWMVLGYYFKQYAEKWFDDKNTLINRCVVWIAYLIVAYIPDPMGWGIVFVQYARNLLGIVAVISLCKVLKSNRYINFVGANTLVYFAFHGKVYAVIEKVLEKYAGALYSMILANPLLSSLLAIMIAFVMSLILIIPAEIINRWFPWMLGRKKR